MTPSEAGRCTSNEVKTQNGGAPMTNDFFKAINLAKYVRYIYMFLLIRCQLQGMQTRYIISVQLT